MKTFTKLFILEVFVLIVIPVGFALLELSLGPSNNTGWAFIVSMLFGVFIGLPIVLATLIYHIISVRSKRR